MSKEKMVWFSDDWERMEGMKHSRPGKAAAV